MEGQAELKMENSENAKTDQVYKGQKSKKVVSCLKTNLLTILTLCGVVLGGALGCVLREVREEKWSAREVMYINFVGDIFLRLLKSLILPLIISSLISAISRLDVSLSGKVAARAIIFYMTTTVCAVILGIVLVTTISPGKLGSDPEQTTQNQSIRNVTTVDTLLDLIRNVFPSNLVEACTHQTRTFLTEPVNKTGNIYEWKVAFENTEGTNIMGLVMFSVILGIALAKAGAQGEPLVNFFECLARIMMIITTWVIWISPIGIFFLVASKIIEIENFQQLIGSLGLYFSTVVVGLFIQGFVIIPLLYFVITRKNPYAYLLNMAQAVATAFGTSSSSATLPVTIKCLEENSGIDSRITRFALPIGATINMDGTALYEAVAAIFIAQMRNIDLSIGDLIAISIMATAASIGAAGIPQAGLVTMVMVLNTVGLPAEEVSLIIAVDWLLDRFRTVVNVMGDAYGTGIVHHLSQKDLIALSISNSI